MHVWVPILSLKVYLTSSILILINMLSFLKKRLATSDRWLLFIHVTIIADPPFSISISKDAIEVPI